MSTVRPFPFDDAVTSSEREHSAHIVERCSTADRQRAHSRPVLARIPEIGSVPERPSRGPAAGRTIPEPSSPAAYRVDAPHAAAAPPRWANTSISTSESASSIQRSHAKDRILANDGFDAFAWAIELTVGAWRMLQPYNPLMRATALFALMAAGGMSITLMMGHGLPAGDPAKEITTAADPPIPATAAPHAAEFNPATAPEAATSSVAPTAAGPADSPQPTDLVTRAPVTIPLPPQYPTTPYPELDLSETAPSGLPQVRTSEPPPAVARLNGSIEEAQPR